MMKRVLILIVLCLGIQVGVKAQKAIGLRLGGGNGYGTEFSFQYGLTQNNRLQADLGINGGDNWGGWSLVGTYQWIHHLEGNFRWYYGVGAGLGSWYNKNGGTNSNTGVYISLDGICGIEYMFPDIPLQLAVDTRPYIGFINSRGFKMDLAISARFLF
ncbi:hypothetical protein K4L44_03165 [Halosquirtibacter laminarini]|uniref:Uncharacterized protein n=1 Tax=Halosquirtibacter laminarini TaxID=3374600 RepID=A0AC61NGV5_9BACT|nr:hypothetical protein K4L44_03165 [Prolixibacteraceae bacterium]